MGVLDVPPPQKKDFYTNNFYWGISGQGQNLAPNTSVATYSVRDTTEVGVEISHAGIGAVDMGIDLRHSLRLADLTTPVTLKVYVRAILDDTPVGAGGASRFGPILWSGDAPYDCRWFLVSERGTAVQSTATQDVFAIPEFRMPFNKFRISWAAQQAPGDGSVRLRVIQRF